MSSIIMEAEPLKEAAMASVLELMATVCSIEEAAAHVSELRQHCAMARCEWLGATAAALHSAAQHG